jgi:hypothetical protein
MSVTAADVSAAGAEPSWRGGAIVVLYHCFVEVALRNQNG